MVKLILFLDFVDTVYVWVGFPLLVTKQWIKMLRLLINYTSTHENLIKLVICKENIT
jgi:hypothetical protein